MISCLLELGLETRLGRAEASARRLCFEVFDCSYDFGSGSGCAFGLEPEYVSYPVVAQVETQNPPQTASSVMAQVSMVPQAHSSNVSRFHPSASAYSNTGAGGGNLSVPTRGERVV